MTLADLSVVKTKRDRVDLYGTLIPAGAKGTIVHVYRSGKHYEVEFCLDNQSLTDAFSEDELELVDDRRKA
jgi:hypothetical protein